MPAGRTAADDPIAGLLALADAYIDWAVDHPTHYRVLGDRPLVDFTIWALSATIAGSATMLGLFKAAEERSLLRDRDIALVAFQCRAMAYGLARMHVDSHLPNSASSRRRHARR